jgi:hypothetical protein
MVQAGNSYLSPSYEAEPNSLASNLADAYCSTSQDAWDAQVRARRQGLADELIQSLCSGSSDDRCGEKYKYMKDEVAIVVATFDYTDERGWVVVTYYVSSKISWTKVALSCDGRSVTLADSSGNPHPTDPRRITMKGALEDQLQQTFCPKVRETKE